MCFCTFLRSEKVLKNMYFEPNLNWVSFRAVLAEIVVILAIINPGKLH